MKKKLFLLSFFVALVPGILFFSPKNHSCYAQDFDIRYKKLDSLPNISRLVYNVPVNLQWADSVHVTYQIQDKEGLKGYKTHVITTTTESWTPEPVNPQRPEYNNRERSREKYISPDGKWEAYIKDYNVWLKDIETLKESPLSYDGTENLYYSRLYWSPDSKKIAALLTRDTPKHRIPLIESAPATQKQPVLQWRDYYKPGDLIPINIPTLFNVELKEQITVNASAFNNPYQLFFRKWSEDSKWYSFDYNERGHQKYQIVNVDAQTGQTKVIVDEVFDTFVHYGRNFIQYITKDKNLVWSSERDGYRHLYLIDAQTGRVQKQLTKGNWVVQQVVSIDEKEGTILFMASGRNKGEDPYNKHYYRMKTDGTGLTDLTPEHANHRVQFSPDKKYFTDTYSRPDKEPVSVIRSSKDGTVLINLGEAVISDLLATGWTVPEVFSAKGRDGTTDIWGTIYRPSHYDPSRSYPVVEYIYAGPHDAHVTKDFAAYMRFSKLVEMGFIVVTIDGMGTANRSKAFHDVCWRNLQDAGFPDRILWIQAAATKYPSMDISRGVGIYGYSAGGQNALSALLFHKDFYNVGVALCGCHDNRMDKIWWNEEWMGYPVGPWYAAASNVDNAHLLEGKLLLINGELDDNVDPTSTLQVVDALVKAGKDFEQLYLPGHGHSLGSDYITRRVFEFFYRHMEPECLNETTPMATYREKPVITAPPTALGLDPFYKKYMNVNGIHVVSSWRVPDSVFQAAYVTVRAMTEALPSEVLESLTSRNTRIGIMARYEGTTDIPEHAFLAKDTTLNWNVRARGLGGTLDNPFSTCAEENIMAYQIDKYHAEDILIHEFAHTIHNVGIAPVYPQFNTELQEALDAAVAEGKYENTYAKTNIEEYFAEGVQNWFDVNAEVPVPDGKHNMVNTREEMKRYDPRLYNILSRFFKEPPGQISRHKKVNLYNQP